MRAAAEEKKKRKDVIFLKRPLVQKKKRRETKKERVVEIKRQNIDKLNLLKPYQSLYFSGPSRRGEATLDEDCAQS
jgi:hypothetical protein